MKIYFVERTDDIGYDEFDSWVVIAKDPKQAKSLCEWGDGTGNHVRVSEIKIGKRPRAILGSFNAG